MTGPLGPRHLQVSRSRLVLEGSETFDPGMRHVLDDRVRKQDIEFVIGGPSSLQFRYTRRGLVARLLSSVRQLVSALAT